MNEELCDFCTFIEDQPLRLSNQSLSCMSLRKCVSQLIINLQPGLIRQCDTIINDVQEDLMVSTQKEILMRILDRLMNIVVINSQHNIIHLSAKTVGSITLMHIRNSHAEYSEEIAEALRDSEHLAESLGGCVTISNNRMYGLSLAFTFLNR